MEMRKPNGMGTAELEARVTRGHNDGIMSGALDGLELPGADGAAAHVPFGVAAYDTPRLIPRGIKRGMDVVIALIGLIGLAPLWLAVAIAIKLDSPGPVLFRQRRVGRGGGDLWMLKFRTMQSDADAERERLRYLSRDGHLFKIDRDPRITRVGRILRATSLDEVPQLWHVLRGEMSLVGPRPLVPEEDALASGHYRVRLAIRPGMTGPWQVNGHDRPSLDEMLELDRDYVLAWSLGRDLVLLARTIPQVLLLRGL